MVELYVSILTLFGIPIFIYCIYTLLVSLPGLGSYEQYKEVKYKNRFAAVIAARNEEDVVGELVESLKSVNYPKELLDIWVIPNNCSDHTKERAEEHGARIYEPKGVIRSKGDALREYFDFIFSEEDHYDAFCIFDADNLVTPEFFNKMNDALEAGEKIAQGYRESKNPKDSWISANQSMFYWLTNRFLNCAKRRLKMSAVLNGTGFMVSREVLKEQGFNTYTLTEDIEYSTQCILKGERIAFVSEAITYDEHPTDFEMSWKQRKRWSTGILQTLRRYGKSLAKNFFKTGKWINLDLIVYLAAPLIQIYTFIYTILTILSFGLILYFFGDFGLHFYIAVIFNSLAFFACALLAVFIVKLEKHKLKDCRFKTYWSFWWFLASWVFINIEVFRKPITTWEPIKHRKSISLQELQTQK